MNDIRSLQEREKELQCLYRIQEAVADRSLAPPSVFLRVLEAIPDGWQYPSQTGARIEYLGHSYVGPGYTTDGPRLIAPIRLADKEFGCIEVVTASREVLGKSDQNAFLPEEQKLLTAIAKRLSEYLEWKHTQMLGDRISSINEHWRWREEYSEALCTYLDWSKYGVSRIFLGGSTENGQAGPGSDIDLYIEFKGNSNMKRELNAWIEGWSYCLAEVAFRQTGYKVSGGLIDLHWIDSSTDRRILQECRELTRKEKSITPG
jgi:hypothetical protein